MHLQYSSLFFLLLLLGCSKADHGTEIPEGQLELVWAVQPEEPVGEPWFAGILMVSVHRTQIFVLDYDRGAVLELDQFGHFVRFIGRQGDGPGEFGRAPSHVSVSPNGYVYIKNDGRNIINKFSSSGDFIERKDYSINPFSDRVLLDVYAIDDTSIVMEIGLSRTGKEVEQYLQEPLLLAFRSEDYIPFGTRPVNEIEMVAMKKLIIDKRGKRGVTLHFTAGITIRGPYNDEMIFLKRGDPYSIHRFHIYQPPISFSFYEPQRNKWIEEIEMPFNDYMNWEWVYLFRHGVMGMASNENLAYRFSFSHTTRGAALLEDKLAILVEVITDSFQSDESLDGIEQYLYMVDLNEEKAELRAKINPIIPQLRLGGALEDGTLIFSTNDPVPGILAYRIVPLS